ncbi:lytic transglycosylase domain-containing protein [candidate division KSB1 bacterium]|nr:lytic transglycosylase domain-containing protein [candidate division KSB1 bacterium]
MERRPFASLFEKLLKTKPPRRRSPAPEVFVASRPPAKHKPGNQKWQRGTSERIAHAWIKPAASACSSWGRQGKIVLLVTLTAMTGISMVSFAFRFYTLDQSAAKMADLQRTINTLKAVMNVDTMRQYQIQKVMALVERYNPAMPSGNKYEIADEIYKMSIKYPNLSVDLICATITHESALTWRPDVRSNAGAMGLMQIMPTTGGFLAADEGIPWTTPQDMLYDPITNIRLGCRYLSTLISLYELDGGLAAYNGGEKRAALWLASGRDNRVLWEETRGYVPAVLKLYEQFQE